MNPLKFLKDSEEFRERVNRTLPPPKNLMISRFRGGQKRENLLGHGDHVNPNLREVPVMLARNQRVAGEKQEGKNVVLQRLHNRRAYPAQEQSQRYNEEIATQSLEFAGSIHRVCKRYLRLRTYFVISGHPQVNGLTTRCG
jgi:hypothetical protein